MWALLLCVACSGVGAITDGSHELHRRNQGLVEKNAASNFLTLASEEKQIFRIGGSIGGRTKVNDLPSASIFVQLRGGADVTSQNNKSPSKAKKGKKKKTRQKSKAPSKDDITEGNSLVVSRQNDQVQLSGSNASIGDGHSQKPSPSLKIEAILISKSVSVIRLIRLGLLSALLNSLSQCAITAGTPYRDALRQLGLSTSENAASANKVLLKYIIRGSKGALLVPPKHLPSWNALLGLFGSLAALILSITLPLAIVDLNVWLNYKKVQIDHFSTDEVNEILSHGPDAAMALVHTPSSSAPSFRHHDDDGDQNDKGERQLLCLNDLAKNIDEEGKRLAIGHPSRWYVEQHQQRLYVNVKTSECTTGAPTFFSTTPLSQLTAHSAGLCTPESLQIAQERYGPYNHLTVSQPTVASSLQQRFASSPLALIQCGASMLYLLEEDPQRALWSLMSNLFYYFNHARHSVRNARELAREVAKQDETVSQMSVKVLRPSALSASNKGAGASVKWLDQSARDVLPGDVVAISVNFTECSSPSSMVVPFDALLLEGNVVCNEAVLTGESVPQSKMPPDTASTKVNDRTIDLEGSEDRQSVLFAGTTIVHATSEEQGFDYPSNRTVDEECPQNLSTPPGYIRCLALRTGSYSSRGELIRYLNQNNNHVDGVGSGNAILERDGLRLMASLSVFAAASCLSLLLDEQKRADGSMCGPVLFRKIIMCSRIATVAVPTDLPLMISDVLASCARYLRSTADVICSSSSPGALLQSAQADTIVFDKTGTLTADTQRMDKIVPNPNDNQSKDAAIVVLSGCHSLVGIQASGKQTEIVGDPLDKSALSFSGWSFDSKKQSAKKPSTVEQRTKINMSNATESCTPEKNWQLQVFPFDPSRRMSSALLLVSFGNNKEYRIWQTVKGAPDAIRQLVIQESKSLTDDALWFDNTMEELSFEGKRVVAMAYADVTEHFKDTLFPRGFPKKSKKTIKKSLLAQARIQAKKSIARSEIEDPSSNAAYQLAGFGSFSASIRASSANIIRQLKDSGLGVCMLTGDGVAAAIAVATQTQVVSRAQAKRGLAVLDVERDGTETGKSSPNLCWTIIRPINNTQKGKTNTILKWKRGKSVKFSYKTVKEAFLSTGGGVVASGEAIDLLLNTNGEQGTCFETESVRAALKFTRSRLHEINVIARASPGTKERVVQALKNDCHRKVVMCGTCNMVATRLVQSRIQKMVVNVRLFLLPIQATASMT
jgi:magnesium-transporting ATPase (P-type)